MSVHKSPYDEKEYRVIWLDNGLTALLISESKLAHPEDSDESELEDEEEVDTQCHSNAKKRSDSHSSSSGDEVISEEDAKKTGRILNCAACGLCVRIGSFHDPQQVPGLAHLLEHMLFMGSKKYPGENEFDAFLSRHGGISDASTDYETTIFYFGVNRKVLKETLDRFAHFFVSPLLLASSLEREIEAVDSEFQSSVQNDDHRIQQMFCSLAVSGHPLSNFPWGNKQTLKEMPQDQQVDLTAHLRWFYQEYYSASCMTITVVSEDSLDTLEEWVRDSFSAIPSHGKPFPSISHCQLVFDNSTFHQIYKVVPVKHSHLLNVTWILPSLLHEYKAKPTNYLGWLVGHEGYGSILSYLKKRNLATGLVAGTGGEDSEFNSCFTLFSCSITLTEKGIENVKECLTVLFQYLKMLRDVGPQERIYKELKLIEENEFNFYGEEDSMDLVERLCVAMQFYSPEDYLIGDELYLEFKPELISSITDLLVPTKCNIMIISQTFTEQCTMKEKWFGTHYTHEAISEEWMESWMTLPTNPELYLPPPNNFIASSFSLVKPDLPETNYPVCIEETISYKLWYKRDYLFKLPRVSINVLFVTPVHFENIKSSVLMELFVRLYDHTIMEIGYEAKVAQLSYSLTVAYRGLSLCMSGLSHKLPNLFKKLITHFSKFTVSEEQFEMAKERLQRSYNNISFKPRKLCKFLRLQVIEKQHFPITEKLLSLQTLSFQDYELFVERLRCTLYIECLMQGNITGAEAKTLLNYACSSLKFESLEKKLQYELKCLRLPSNTEVIVLAGNRDPLSPNTVLTDYYQCSVADPREGTIAQLLVKCMEEPCFDSLRTKQQLGYTVYVNVHDTHNVTGISLNLVTQVQKFSTTYASKCMSDFMHGFLAQLQSWNEDDFLSHVNALIDDKEADDNSIDDEVERNWSEILTQTYIFDRLEQQIKTLEKISKTKACKWLERYTHPGENYRKLSVKVVSSLTSHEQNGPPPKDESTYLEPQTSCPPFSNTINGFDPLLSISKPNIIIIKEEEIPILKSTLKQYPRGPSVS